MLDPSCLVPPTIPNTLGAEDIDKVIAALTNVPTMHGPPLGTEEGRGGRSRSRERRRRRSRSGPPVHQARDGDRAENYGGDAEYDKMRRGGMASTRPVNDYDNDGGRRFMGRGGRGGLADLASSRLGARSPPRPPERFKGGWVAGSGRGGPVARGRNVFPAQEKRGKRVNNLFKRFQAQHRDKLGAPEGDLLYDGLDIVKSRREMREDRMRRTKTRSRTRSRSRGRRSRKRSASSSSDSDSSSSSDDSDSHKKRKKKIKKEKKDKKDKKEKKKKKKKDSGKKKKKDKSSSSESEEEKKGEGLDWRVDLLKKMKDIKNLPPEELEAEFKKAMIEKKKKEDEEKCLMAIKERQKMARRVKRQAEKLEKKEAKLKAKEERDAEEEEQANDGFYGGGGDGGFYNGFEDALGRMQSLEQNNELPEDAAKPFMSSFNEVPFVAEEGVVQGEEGGVEGEQGEQDPYARAQAEARKREQRGSVDQEVSWPAGAIENNMEGDMGMGEEMEMTKEMMDAEQEAMEQEANNLDDKTKDVVNTSKMFSKIRNRIKGKPLKIHLKSAKRSTEEADEGVGLEPVATPGEGLSGEEQEQFGDYEYGEFEGGGMEEEYDMRQEPGGRSARASGEREEDGDEEEERRVARYRERAERRRRERQEDREDGEHSPSPEPERPHHRRRRRRRHERREGTPVRDEGALEDGEVVEGGRRERRRRHRTPEGYQGPRDLGPPGSFPGSILGPPPGHGPPAAPPPFVPPPLSVDTSVPPPSLAGLGVIDKDRAGPIVGPGYGYGGPGHGPPRDPMGSGPREQPPPFQQGIPLGGRGFGNRTSPTYRGPPQQTSPSYRGPPHATSPQYHGPPQPPSPNFRGPQHPAVQQGNHASQANHQSGFQHGPPAPQYRHQPPSPSYQGPPAPEPRWDAYSGGRRAPPPDLRRAQQPEVKRENNATFFDSLPTEAVDSAEEEEEAEVDITKVSPIMKYMAAKLVEQKYHLELAGPFAYRADTPGLSRHLFVAARMVALLEGAGYTGSKMYMSAMFPAGLQATKEELVGLVSSGKLHAGIQGSRLVKMCVRCVRCFLAYYTGKSDDIDTSEGECSDSGEEGGAAEEEGRQNSSRTVTTSLMDVLQRAKEEDGQEVQKAEVAAPVAAGRYSAEDNPWQSMELGMRSEKLRSFTALQSHFTKQLVGRGVDQRDAREQAGDSMMCLVVADFNDASLRYMVEKWKKVILPEQSQLEVTRARADQTLYDQLVTKLLKYQAEFPLSIIQEVQAEADPQAALTRRVRGLVERVLKFYMRGLGREQQGKAEATTGLAAPADPAGLQFNYLPEGLREEEGAPDGQPPRNGSNFFNMDAAATANRQFSSYKRLSLDDSALEPVSPEHTAFTGPAAGKAATLPRQKYLFGTMYVDTLLYQGSSYVYEIGVHMADSSSIEVYIVPTKLFKQNSVLEMLGFSFNPDEKKYIYVKPGTGGFSKTYSEEHGLERVVQFLKEKRYDSRGDSENRGLVLATQGVEDLATWVKFSGFHGKEWELREVVGGYGCLDLWVEAQGGACSYTGPRLHRENSGQGSTFFTWEYQVGHRHRDTFKRSKPL